MSMTKRWLEDLTEKAVHGDKAAERTLIEVGYLNEPIAEMNIHEMEIVAVETFAETSWCVDDVLQVAKQNNIEMNEQQAKELLEEGEEDILEAMFSVAWDVVEEKIKARKKLTV